MIIGVITITKTSFMFGETKGESKGERASSAGFGFWKIIVARREGGCGWFWFFENCCRTERG